MKYILSIAAMSCMGLIARAQVTPQKVDSAMHKIDKARLMSGALLDSTRLNVNTKLDKITRKPTLVKQKLDSVSTMFENRNNMRSAVAQDSARLKNMGRPQYDPAAIQHRLDSINTVLKKNKDAVSLLDSVNGKIDNVLGKIQPPKASTGVDSLTNKIDSLQHKAVALLNAPALKVEEHSKHFADSITKKVNATLQAGKLTSKIDSIKAAGLSTGAYTKKLDSLNALTDVNKQLQTPLKKLNENQAKAQKVQDAPTKKINEKIDLLSKETGAKGNLERVDLPTKELGIDKNSMPGTLGKRTDVDLILGQPLPGINQRSPGDKVGNLTNNLHATEQLDKAVSPNTLGGLQKGVGNVTGVVDNAGNKVSGYATDLKNTKDGNLDNVQAIKNGDVISKLPVSDELKMLGVKDEFINAQEAVIAPYKNPDAYKKQALARAKKMVAAQLIIQDKQLQEVVKKVSSYQNKMGTLLSKTSDLPKKRDSLKKLRRVEKFVPGITFQIQKPGAWLVDINPSLRYRLTSYWSAGLGWNERVLFGKYRLSYDQTRVFGVRTFSEVVIFKGLSFRLDVENMKTFIIPQQPVQTGSDQGHRSWVWSYRGGIKKEFSFVRGVSGNAQFMYNLYSSNAANAYPTKFNVRFGFERIFRQKTKHKKV